MKRIGVADTTFARYDMALSAIEELRGLTPEHETAVVRRTVPGVKDLAVACKQLFVVENCDLVLALGFIGAEPVDKVCAHEASTAIQQVQLDSMKHILEVFVHADEAKDDRTLAWLMDRRAREHAVNAFRLLVRPEELVRLAGTGQRQGFADAGPLIDGKRIDPSPTPPGS